jgi:hypothetical protein
MRYTVIYMKKNGKVTGKVGCNNYRTVDHLVNMWKETPKHGTCLVIDNETKEETFYNK